MGQTDDDLPRLVQLHQLQCGQPLQPMSSLPLFGVGFGAHHLGKEWREDDGVHHLVQEQRQDVGEVLEQEEEEVEGGTSGWPSWLNVSNCGEPAANQA